MQQSYILDDLFQPSSMLFEGQYYKVMLFLDGLFQPSPYGIGVYVANNLFQSSQLESSLVQFSPAIAIDIKGRK